MKTSKKLNPFKRWRLMKKRMISVITAVFIISSFFVRVPVKAKNDELYTVMAQKLEALGVLSTDIAFDKVVSRGEFAQRIVDAYGSALNFEHKVQYADVSDNNTYSSAISIVSALKLMRGYEDGNFLPNRAITVAEAIKVMVCCLGYEPLAQVSGGYPNAYLSIALKIELLKDFSYSLNNSLTGKDFVVLLNNAIEAEYMDMTVAGNTYSYETNTNTTLLTKYHQIYKSEGVVKGTNITMLTTESSLSSGRVLIENEEYFAGSTCAEQMLGYRVEFYYKEENGNKEIMYITPKRTEVTVIREQDFAGFSDSGLTYYDNGKIRKISLSSQIDCIYNGKAMLPFDASEMNISNGTLTFIDNNSDGAYDVLFIDKISNYVVGSVDTDNNLVYDKYSGSTLNLEKLVKGVPIRNENGEAIDVAVLGEWDVLCVKEAKDGELTSVIVAAEEIEGSITEIMEDSFVIDGSSYKIAENYSKYGKPLELGLTAMFYLDTEGRIAALREDLAFRKKYAFLVGAETVSAISGRMRIWLYTSDGEFLKAMSAKTMKLDGKRVKNVSDPIDYLNSIKGIVVYEINADEEISSIDTRNKSSEENEYTLERYYSAYIDEHGNTLSEPEEITYREKPNLFGGKVCLKNDSVIFKVPMDDTGDFDSYEILTKDMLINGKYVIEGYRTQPTSHFAEAIIIDAASQNLKTIISGTPMAIVKKIRSVVLESGETVTKLYLSDSRGNSPEACVRDNSVFDAAYGENANLTDEVEDTVYKITPGDLIRYSTDTKGFVKSISVIYDAETEDFYSASANSSYITKDRIISGYIAAVDRGNMMLSKKQPSVFDVKTDEFEYYNAGLFKIWVCDMKTGKAEVRMGTTEDLIPSDNAKVVIQSFYAGSGAITVYKK